MEYRICCSASAIRGWWPRPSHRQQRSTGKAARDDRYEYVQETFLAPRTGPAHHAPQRVMDDRLLTRWCDRSGQSGGYLDSYFPTLRAFPPMFEYIS